jgi:16S rRNA (adenine1518-N6/adenine1519-N6)-dimethyltransferase
VKPGPDERLLHDVLGARRVGAEAFDVVVQGPGVTRVQLSDGGVGVASAPQASASGFHAPYTIPDTATAVLGVLLAVTILATVGHARQTPYILTGQRAGASVTGVGMPDTGQDHASREPRLLGPADIRRIAGRLGVRPSKRLGQNFVTDAGTVRRIAALAGVRQDDVVLEVGPGFGSLTLPLLAAAGRVVAVEVDPALAGELPRTVAARAPGLAARLEVVAADAARVRDLPGPPPTALVANLPYNVAVPVVLHLLATVPSLRRGLVMVQAEVADRMSAPPGSRTYGVPSVKLAWFAEARRAGPVPRTVFWPVPRVDSGLVAFTRREPPPGATREEVFTVVDAAFAQRRKTLRAALAPWAGSAAAAEQVLRMASVDPGLRGESLGVAEFARIAIAGRQLVPGTSA